MRVCLFDIFICFIFGIEINQIKLNYFIMIYIIVFVSIQWLRKPEICVVEKIENKPNEVGLNLLSTLGGCLVGIL